MMSKEANSTERALKLALEALENSVDLVREDAYQAEKLYGNYPTRQGKVNGLQVLADDHEKAITALREALAEPPTKAGELRAMKRDFWEGYVPEPDKRQQALDKKAENARELGLDYEPAQQEPFGYFRYDLRLDAWVQNKAGLTGTPFYTFPPAQRTWVGLTNNELQPIADEYRILFGSWVEDFARAIEAKLKEKNA